MNDAADPAEDPLDRLEFHPLLRLELERLRALQTKQAEHERARAERDASRPLVSFAAAAETNTGTPPPAAVWAARARRPGRAPARRPCRPRPRCSRCGEIRHCAGRRRNAMRCWDCFVGDGA